MDDVKRYDVQGKFESTNGEGISLLNPKMVLEQDYDAKCHAAEVYFGSWKRTEQELDAQRLLADTAEAERDAARQALDATRDALESAQYSNAELASKLEDRDQLFSDLVNSPHAVSVPLELWKRIKVFAGAALNPKPEAGSHE